MLNVLIGIVIGIAATALGIALFAIVTDKKKELYEQSQMDEQ